MSGGGGNSSVKRESRSTAVPLTQEDRDLDEWARKLVSRPTPQIGNSTGLSGGGTLNSFIIQSSNQLGNSSNQAGPDGLRPHHGYDIDSAIGRFTWHTIGEDKYIPCLFRCGEKFCSVRMVEVSLVGEYLKVLPVDMFDCIGITSYAVTGVEAFLLSYINMWHCDGFYGPEAFLTKDQLVRIEDVEKLYEFLVFAYAVLSTGGRNTKQDYSKCAFLRVNSDSLIPYTVLPDGEKGVPFFYFEGQTDILKEKAVPLEGWPLAYLKVCCRVQGVRKDLIGGSTLQIVKICDLRTYFPKKTMFTEDMWPGPKSKSLLSSKANGMTTNCTVSPVPNYEKWCTLKAYSNPNAPPATIQTGTESTNSAASTKSTTSTPISISNPLSQQLSVIPQSMRNGGLMNSSAGNNQNQTIRVANGTVSSIPQCMQAKSKDLAKIKLITPPQDTSRLVTIPECTSNREGAYDVRFIVVEKELMHSINKTAHGTGEPLVPLQKFMEKFFPAVSIYPTAVAVLKNLGVSTFLPNRSQIQTLNNFGFNIQYPWQVPLVHAVNISQVMPKLKSILLRRDSAATTLVHNTGSRNGYVAAIR